MSQEIRNIVFDMGQVLIDFNPGVFIDRLGIAGEDKDLLLREVFRSVEWMCLDRGSMDEEAAWTGMCARLPARLHGAARELVFSWWHRPLIPIPGTAELVGELKAMGYGIYLLSNASRQVPRYFPRIPGSEYFDGEFVSAFYHLIKPQYAIYRKFCETFGLAAESCFFVDDQPVNIEAAIGTGMRGAVFYGDIPRLRRDLNAAGVPVKLETP